MLEFVMLHPFLSAAGLIAGLILTGYLFARSWAQRGRADGYRFEDYRRR